MQIKVESLIKCLENPSLKETMETRNQVFNEKNEAVIEHAMYLTNFMYKRENFYFEILNNSYYLTFLYKN